MTYEERFLSLCVPEPNSGCWLWIGSVNPKGYGRIKFRGTTWVASRVAWTLWSGEIPEGNLVLHKCDTPGCVNITHLFLGSAADNTRDMLSKGRQCCGSDHYCARLTADAVREIRASPESLRSLARRYGVAWLTVRDAKFGVTWRHLLEAATPRGTNREALLERGGSADE